MGVAEIAEAGYNELPHFRKKVSGMSDSHAHCHEYGFPHTHGHVHENQKAVVNRLARAIGHLE